MYSTVGAGSDMQAKTCLRQFRTQAVEYTILHATSNIEYAGLDCIFQFRISLDEEW
jgi:hypothetical protein